MSKKACVFLLSVLGSSVVTGVFASGSTQTKAATQAVQEAVEAAKAVPVPDYTALQKTPAVQDFVSANSGNTGQIEALRQNGQGALYAPGRSEADACWSRNDPHCLAVQMVDKGSTNRPQLDPDLAGDLIAGRDEVLDHIDDYVNVDGNGSSAGSCTSHTTTITKPEETVTCDVRTTQTPGTSTENTCEHFFDAITSVESVWACKTTHRETEDKTCSVPVVVRQQTTTTLACFEGKQNASKESCPVTVTTGKKEKHVAACVKPQLKSITKTCTRRLVVKADASCKIGSEQTATNTNHAELAEDAVSGADTLSVTSRCVEKGLQLTLATNSRAGVKPDLAVTVTTDVFETVQSVTGGLVRYKGSVTCNKADCLADVAMRVYKASGTSHVYQGEVSVRLAFTRFVKTAETEHWSETCTGL